VNLPTIMHVKPFTKLFFVVSVATSCFFSAQGDWKIDFSRRLEEKPQVEVNSKVLEDLAQPKDLNWLVEKQVTGGNRAQELVVLNTEKGFVPTTIYLREGNIYKIHVVNVNEREKNISFVLDSFSEYHATYFGQIKSFTVRPKKEGIFSFVCPETSAHGKLVVYQPLGVTSRLPASEK